MFAGQPLTGVQQYSLPFNTISNIPFAPAATVTGTAPVLRKGSFNLAQVADTYLEMSNCGKGVVWINGRNQGRN